VAHAVHVVIVHELSIVAHGHSHVLKLMVYAPRLFRVLYRVIRTCYFT
jgi:hypothetical protein